MSIAEKLQSLIGWTGTLANFVLQYIPGLQVQKHTMSTNSSGAYVVLPNRVNVLSANISSTTTFAKGTEYALLQNYYVVRFTIDSSVSSTEGIVAFATEFGTLKYANGEAPTWEAGKTYEVSISDDTCTCLTFSTPA